MQENLQWRSESSEPLHRQDLQNCITERTDPYGRHVSYNVSNEGYKDTHVYKKAVHTLVAKNQVLTRENEVLRKFLLLKKENCDLKTLDIITNALSMCDEKLNEFILNLHNFDDRPKSVPYADVDLRPQHMVKPKPDNYQTILKQERAQSPSYGASFPEIHYSELEAYDDNQISMSPSDNRRYPGHYKKKNVLDGYSDSKQFSSRHIYDDSASYGQSFPQLDYNELLEDTQLNQEERNTTEYEVTCRDKYPNKSPVVASVSTPRTHISPAQRNTPDRGMQHVTVNQPPTQSFLETARQCLRTATPTRFPHEISDDLESQQTNISEALFRPQPSKFSSSKPASCSSTPRGTVFYDSLEASKLEDRKFTAHPSGSKRPVTSLSSYQKQAGRFVAASVNDDTPPNMSSGWSGNRYHDEMYKDKIKSPATGNIDSFCQCSSPIYVNSGQHRERNLIDTENLNETNYRNSQTSAGQTLRNASPTGTEAPRYTRNREVIHDSKPSNRPAPSPSPTDRSDFEIVHEDERVIIKSPRSSLKKHVVEADNKNLAGQSQMKQVESIIGAQTEQLRISNGQTRKAEDNYQRTDTKRSIENSQESNEKSVWINITQRARVLTEGHDDGQDQHDSFCSKVYTTAIEHQQEEESTHTTTADFCVIEPPLYTSTPKHCYRKKEACDLPAKAFDQRPCMKPGDKIYKQIMTNLAQNLTYVSPRDAALNMRSDSTYTSNVGSVSEEIAPGHDSTGNRREFDKSLAEAVDQAHPKLGRSEIVNSVLFRPVDTLTGYNPNVTLLTTSMALRSRPKKRLVGEIAFQLDRRIMELVIGPNRSSSDKNIKRLRYYGYSVANIDQLIKKEAMLKSQTSPADIHKEEAKMRQCLEQVLATLKPFGYKLDVHAYFAQDMVNKYGLMKEAPRMDTVEGFGLHEPVVLRMLLGRILGHGPVLDNMLILLDCLCILSHSDKSPLFLW